jgi:hypothetical protein
VCSAQAETERQPHHKGFPDTAIDACHCVLQALKANLECAVRELKLNANHITIGLLTLPVMLAMVCCRR